MAANESPQTATASEFIGNAEVCALLGCSTSTAKRLDRLGMLPAFGVIGGRLAWRRTDVTAYHFVDGRTSDARGVSVDRKAQAYQLRREGKTFWQIGEALGVCKERARQLSCEGMPEWIAIRQETAKLRASGKSKKEINGIMDERKREANQHCKLIYRHATRLTHGG